VKTNSELEYLID